MIQALRTLGFEIEADWERDAVRVRRGESASLVPAKEADLFLGNSGTSMRFLTALVCLGQGHYRLDGVTRMRERPIADLVKALAHLGVDITCETAKSAPPVVVSAAGMKGGKVSIRGDLSSQFLSGLLMIAPLTRDGIIIEVQGSLVSQPYAAMTVAMMRQFGAVVDTDMHQYFRVPPIPCYDATEFDIEPDASAASYFFGAAAIARGTVTVPGLPEDSLQGDVRFTQILRSMGCKVQRTVMGLTVDATSGGRLIGILVDMNDISDCVMTLAAVACFAHGHTTIRNVAHIRHKETDRLHALATELCKVGAAVEEFADGLVITPQSLHAASIDTYNDHRMAMSMALIGLVTPGITIKNPACVAKTYPRFFQDLELLRA
jgi:3-phosphoshikimate 1-carboxyvinyltransferase